MSRKFALIIGNSQYQDARLSQLMTPQEDVNDLADVLRAPDIGGFDEVKALVNETDANIRLSLEDFFADKKPDDLLVIYFSGHGVRDEQGQLYLAVNNTRATRLRATAIPSEFITDEMDRSRSKRQVLILDCCHSGAFAQGSKALTGASAGTGPAFEGLGYGRVVLTATDATQYAWEGDQVIGQADRSVFTHYLIEGLRTGEADLDHDGTITLDEMYDYVYEKVVTATPKQTPGKWSYKQQGDIVIAHNPHPPARPAAPPLEILDTARRFSAVKTARLLVRQGINPGGLYPLIAATNTIGRSDGLEVTVRDTLSSRRHARITRRDHDYLIEDLLSANGTLVNGTRLSAPQVLKDGDQITIGDTILIFQLGEAAAVAIAASEKSSDDQVPVNAALVPGAAADQPQPPSASTQPTGPLPRTEIPKPARSISSKWIAVGAVVGGVVLLFALLSAAAPGLTPQPAPTEFFAEPDAAAALPPATQEESTQPPDPDPTAAVDQSDLNPLELARTTWNLVIDDSFDSNDNQWDTAPIDDPDDFAGTREIVDGRFHWELQAYRDFATMASVVHHTGSDFYVSVDMHQLAGSTVCGYGLLLRESNDGLYQFGLTDGARQFSVFAWNEAAGSSQPLIGETESEALRPGDVNTLAVIAAGPHYQFFINDQPVGEITDDEWTTGDVKLFAQLCEDGDSAVIEFDNIELRTP
jgi:uncharacterized caspase-like protein/pSer/pThr/pTyr-binding forkhead associated (FHA) protein